MKVIIVGGGIGGLTLANSLQHANIEYVLIERRDRLDPPEGASVGIQPNGARLLDQLGCYDDMEQMAAGMDTSATHRKDGNLIGAVSDSLALMRQRTGYSVYFLDRQYLLRILAKHILDPSRIMLQKSVKTIEQGPNKATVQCTDGTSIEGDVVVGADGTYSMVRREMWRQAEADGRGAAFEDDRKAMSAEYKCLFGISSSIPGMSTGQTDRTYAKDLSTLSYVGKAGRVFWFVFLKMDKIYHASAIPRFTPADADEMIESVGSLPIRENGSVTVEHLYRARVASHLVSIEEAEYRNWSYGRLVCLGDSVHKMTPNLGAGASSAMEDAAVLSNVLVRLQASKATGVDIARAFQEEYHSSRALRVHRALRYSNQLTRVQTLASNKAWFYTHIVAPRMDDFAADAFSSFVIGAPMIDHLPAPPRSMKGTMPFNPTQGWGFEESSKQRALRALPLLALALVSYRYADSTSPYRAETDISVLSQVMTCLWIVESTRRSNKGSLLELWIVFAMISGWLGITVAVPLFLFLLYTQSPYEKFRAADGRLTDVSYTSTAAPLLILSSLASWWLQTQASGSQLNTVGHWIEDTKPYLIFAVQFVLARTVIPSSVQNDRLWAVRKDVPWIRGTSAVMIAAAAIVPIVRLLSIVENFSWDHVTDLVALWLPRQELICSVGIALWLSLVYFDLDQAGMVQGRLQLLGGLLPLLSLGPAMVLAVGWLWREEILINKKHKNAVV